MINKLLVAIDGSPNAQRALEFATDLAARYPCELHIVNAINHDEIPDSLEHMAEVEHIVEPEIELTVPATGTFPSELAMEFENNRDRSLAILAKISDYLLERARREASEQGVKTVKTHSRNGDPAEVILEVAKANSVDVIVTGRRGLGTLKSLFLGSVSSKISQHTELTCIHVS